MGSVRVGIVAMRRRCWNYSNAAVREWPEQAGNAASVRRDGSVAIRIAAPLPAP